MILLETSSKDNTVFEMAEEYEESEEYEEHEEPEELRAGWRKYYKNEYGQKPSDEIINSCLVENCLNIQHRKFDFIPQSIFKMAFLTKLSLKWKIICLLLLKVIKEKVNRIEKLTKEYKKKILKQ